MDSIIKKITPNVDESMIRELLKQIVINQSLRLAPPDQPFILASGKKSTYYIDGKKTTCDPRGLFYFSLLLLERCRELNLDALGGPTLGADPIGGGVANLSFTTEQNLPCFMVRKEAKKHGTQNRVEGAEVKGKRVAVVDDVITTGGSAIKAIQTLRELDAEVVKVFALVDRQQGGREAFAEIGVDYDPIFSIDELLPPENRQTNDS